MLVEKNLYKLRFTWPHSQPVIILNFKQDVVFARNVRRVFHFAQRWIYGMRSTFNIPKLRFYIFVC